jgi:acylphosphatase
MLRKHVYLSGQVQGVYFREHTRQVAQKLNLTGWVRNLRDGRVEAVFEGSGPAVTEMLWWCAQGPPSARVEKIEETSETYRGDFLDFKILPTK